MCALTAALLAGCATSEKTLTLETRVTLPEPPAGIEACLHREFPEIPDRALTKQDVVRIIGQAKVIDRAKTACGERARKWIELVDRDFSKSTP